MIFRNVTALQSNPDKSFFKEKIDIYIKTVASAAKKYNLQPPQINQSLCVEEMIDMGLISAQGELRDLNNFLKSKKFEQFMEAVAYVLENEALLRPFVERLSNKSRAERQHYEKSRNAFTLVDLFCGAGGFSLGFQQVGFKTLLANDLDRLCTETYKYNHMEIPSPQIICGDIRQLSQYIEQSVADEVDVVIGGPPCQGFSSANKHHRIIDDPRNELYKYFLICVARLTPKIVIMENVKGMLKVAGQVVEDYEAISVNKNGNTYTYRVAYKLLNSVDFSVAQSRERLLYIAVRNDISAALDLRPETVFDLISNYTAHRARYILKDALEGVRELEPPHAMNVGEVDTEEGGKKIDVNPYTGAENGYLRLINQGKEIPLVFNHKARYCSLLNHEIYGRMAQGDDATSACIADIMPYAHRNDKFKDKYFRLYADRPCRTITAHLRSDCHSHIHPTQARALTPREAARAQSFPDDYLFLGPYLKTYTQIGNAVPVIMARGIAQVVRQILEQAGEQRENP